MRRPLGITIVGGLIVSQLLTLFTTPVVYLFFDRLRARMAKTDLSTRPSLTGKSPIDEVEQIFLERDPIFRSVADITIEVDALSEDSALASVLATLG